MRALNVTRSTILGERVRLAENLVTRIVGLLGERRLAAGDGLLISPSQGVHTWGMLFPIDVIVLDSQWQVIAVRPALRPWRMTRIFRKGSAVLELPSGMAAATGTVPGDQVEFELTAASAV